MRHGHRADDPGNPVGIQIPVQRPLDPDISSIGIEMADQTGDFLKDQEIKMIYASPFLRTTHTAAQIAEKLNLPIRLEWGVAEYFVPQWFADWPGTLAPQELKRRFPRVDSYYPQTGIMPKCSEEYWDMHNRSMQTVNTLFARHPNENILVVTHAAVACTVPPGLTSWDNWQARPFLCGLSCLSKTDKGWNLDYNAKTDHMKNVMV